MVGLWLRLAFRVRVILMLELHLVVRLSVIVRVRGYS